MIHESLWLAGLQLRIPFLVKELSLEPGAKEVDVSRRQFGVEVVADDRQTAITLTREENGHHRMSLLSPVSSLDEATFYSQGFQSTIHNFSDPCISMRLYSSNNETVLVADCNFPLMGYVLDEIDAMVFRFFREKAFRVDELAASMAGPLQLPDPLTSKGEWSEAMLELLEDFGALRTRRI